MEKLNTLKRKSELFLVKGQGVALKILISYPALDLTAKMPTDDTAKIRCRKTTTAAPVPRCIAPLNLLLT